MNTINAHKARLFGGYLFSDNESNEISQENLKSKKRWSDDMIIPQKYLVVVTKYRHPVLKGAIKVYLLDQTKTIFDSWHCTIKAVNTDLDHIHILFEAPPQVQLSKLANNYKTVTSRLIRKNFSEQLKQYYWKPYFWSDSYFVCSVSDRTESAVKSYIDSQ